MHSDVSSQSGQRTDAHGEDVAVLEQVSYQYPTASDCALKDISLRIRRGEFLGIVGATGAGKSTLCMALNGIVPQFYGGRFWGRIRIDGLDTLEHPIASLAQRVGQVFEDPETQLIATSVENEVAFALENQRVPRDEIRLRIAEVLDLVRLSHVRSKSPNALSGGQKQRLAIAAALATRPRLLVLDEPTSQLDPVGAFEIFATVRELNRKLGMTVVLVSHAAEELAECADRIALLSDGRLLTIGATSDVLGDVEMLLAQHVRPPQVTSTFHLLRQAGAPLSRLPTRMSEVSALVPSLQLEPSASPSLPQPPLRSGARPLITAENLHYSYPDGTAALKGVSLSIREGEYVVIVGQNGAGKSTLVRLFMKLLSPKSGRIHVQDQDLATLEGSDLARRIGYVAQNPDHQIFCSSVEEEVSFALRHIGYSTAEIEHRTAESLRSMGLLSVRRVHPLSLPKGDRARVVIAAVLAMQPEAVIFDEPTTGQDYRGARYILDLTQALHRAGKTVVVITHHLYLMPDYAERVVVMGSGSILLDAPIRQAFHSVDVLRRTFLSPPQAVLLARELDASKKLGLQLLTPAEIARHFAVRRKETAS
ncbi:MAG: ATP-binding cassette domain-containing protein [Myxococcales bacterium]|nr:ATP-binding cassette domain-containing protein [Myxococcales bacterium]